MAGNELARVLGELGGIPLITRVAQMTNDRYVIYLPKKLNPLWRKLRDKAIEIEVIVRPLATGKNK
ncbi:MAG: hypothetical protein DRO40_08005 [Thermoprotei archaeon]|nr:MAG: hypothetical protein DRO40_08005 [Thermoprotei archaeon]